MNRRWRGARTAKKGRRWSPPWPFVAPPPPEVQQGWRHQAGRPWPFPALRRGQRWEPQPAFTPPPPPELVARWQRHTAAIWRPPRHRISRWDVPPAATTRPADNLGTRGGWHPPSRRGHRFEPPWPSTPTAPAEYLPAFRASRKPRSWPLLARGVHWDPPWPTPTAPAGEPPPRPLGARRPPRPPARGASRFDPPWTILAVPRWQSACRHQPRRCRAGRYFSPPWLAPPEPGVWTPGFQRRAGRPPTFGSALATIAGQRFSPPWPDIIAGPEPVGDGKATISATTTGRLTSTGRQTRASSAASSRTLTSATTQTVTGSQTGGQP